MVMGGGLGGDVDYSTEFDDEEEEMLMNPAMGGGLGDVEDYSKYVDGEASEAASASKGKKKAVSAASVGASTQKYRAACQQVWQLASGVNTVMEAVPRQVILQTDGSLLMSNVALKAVKELVDGVGSRFTATGELN